MQRDGNAHVAHAGSPAARDCPCARGGTGKSPAAVTCPEQGRAVASLPQQQTVLPGRSAAGRRGVRVPSGTCVQLSRSPAAAPGPDPGPGTAPQPLPNVPRPPLPSAGWGRGNYSQPATTAKGFSSPHPGQREIQDRNPGWKPKTRQC